MHGNMANSMQYGKAGGEKECAESVQPIAYQKSVQFRIYRKKYSNSDIISLTDWAAYYVTGRGQQICHCPICADNYDLSDEVHYKYENL